jgi:hypothetical protein
MGRCAAGSLRRVGNAGTLSESEPRKLNIVGVKSAHQLFVD